MRYFLLLFEKQKKVGPRADFKNVIIASFMLCLLFSFHYCWSFSVTFFIWLSVLTALINKVAQTITEYSQKSVNHKYPLTEFEMKAPFNVSGVCRLSVSLTVIENFVWHFSLTGSAAIRLISWHTVWNEPPGGKKTPFLILCWR